MTRKMKMAVFMLGLLLVVSGAWAGVNSSAVFKIDVDADNNGVPDGAYPTTVTVAENGMITLFVVLTGAQNLVGVNCDLQFDPDKLNLEAIEETISDLNFDGKANLVDLSNFALAYKKSAGDPAYVSYYDRNRDNTINLVDLANFAIGYKKPGAFWTVNADSFTGNRESVEIYDPVSRSNKDGASAGVVDDIVAVLLRRPETNATGFGFDGDAIVSKLVFKRLAAGNVTLSFTDMVALDETGTEDAPTGVAVTVQ